MSQNREFYEILEEKLKNQEEKDLKFSHPSSHFADFEWADCPLKGLNNGYHYEVQFRGQELYRQNQSRDSHKKTNYQTAEPIMAPPFPAEPPQSEASISRSHLSGPGALAWEQFCEWGASWCTEKPLYKSELKRAYKLLARKFHPDFDDSQSNEGLRQRTELFLYLQEVYQALLSEFDEI